MLSFQDTPTAVSANYVGLGTLSEDENKGK